MTVPTLAEMLRFIAEPPPVFRAEPEGFPGGTVRVRAVVADLFELLGQTARPEALDAMAPHDFTRPERNRMRLILAAAHLLSHPAFRDLAPLRQSLERLLIQDLSHMAAAVDVEQLDADEERREELLRRTLRAIGASLPGESQAEGEDRFRQVDSVERARVLKAAAEREKRAREVREAMARKAAEEAAAKVTRE
jgi:hypothetical protein